MKSRSPNGFTLVEMLIVMVIIAVIAGLVMGVAGLANTKANRNRANGEIVALGTACENYKTDNGVYPRDAGTTEPVDDKSAPPIDPRTDGDPSTKNYWAASLFLYQQLWGDADLDGRGGDNGAKVYMDPKPNMLGYNNSNSGGSGTTKQVAYLQDPWGYSYGYSTAAAKMEDSYRDQAKSASTSGTSGAENKGFQRATDLHGYNPTFDIWSTAGTKTTPPTDTTHAKWVKNW